MDVLLFTSFDSHSLPRFDSSPCASLRWGFQYLDAALPSKGRSNEKEVTHKHTTRKTPHTTRQEQQHKRPHEEPPPSLNNDRQWVNTGWRVLLLLPLLLLLLHGSNRNVVRVNPDCWRTGSSPAVSPRVSRGMRCSPHGIPEYDIANDGFSADSAPPRPPRRPTRTPLHQCGSTTSQTHGRHDDQPSTGGYYNLRWGGASFCSCHVWSVEL